jgi:hypothetical protein
LLGNSYALGLKNEEEINIESGGKVVACCFMNGMEILCREGFG